MKSILKKHQKISKLNWNAIERMLTLGNICKPGLVKGIDLRKKVIDGLSKKQH